MTTSAPSSSLTLPTPIASCAIKQIENSITNGSGLTSVPADSVVMDMESYNPDYSRIIMKRGLNPQRPEGAVIITKQVDSKSGAITIVCGIPSQSSASRGVAITGDSADLASQTAEQMAIINLGLGSAIPVAQAYAQAQSSQAPGALGAYTYRTDKDVVPKTPLDAARAVGTALSSVSINAPILTATRSYAAGNERPKQPPTVVGKDSKVDMRGFAGAIGAGAGIARDPDRPAVQAFSSPILQDEPMSDWIWMLLVAVFVLVAAYMAYRQRDAIKAGVMGLFKRNET